MKAAASPARQPELRSRPLPIALGPGLAGFLLAVLPLAAQMDSTLIRAQCEMIHQIEDQSILYGVVIDGRSGTPLPGSIVHLSWVARGATGDSVVNQAAIESDDGAYIFCDVPQDTRIVAWADALGLTSPQTAFHFVGGESTREDLSVHLRQVLGSISGILIDDTTDRPIGGATLRVPGARVSGLSDANGRFRLTEIPVGSHDVIVSHVAYGEPTIMLSVSPTMSTHAVIRLDPQPIAVEPISVEITARRRWLENNGFYDRVESRLGSFVTPEEIEAQSYRSFAEILRSIPAVNLRQVCAPHCQVRIRMAGSTMPGCVPTFYVDGRRVNQLTDPDDGTIDLDMLAGGSDIAALEVFRGISETPPEFFGRCGSIVVWTKRGAG